MGFKKSKSKNNVLQNSKRKKGLFKDNKRKKYEVPGNRDSLKKVEKAGHSRDVLTAKQRYFREKQAESKRKQYEVPGNRDSIKKFEKAVHSSNALTAKQQYFREKKADNKRKKYEVPRNRDSLIKVEKAVHSSDALTAKHVTEKQAITKLSELRDVLGVAEKRDRNEIELENFVFGCAADELEDGFSDLEFEEEKEEVKEVKNAAWEDQDDESILVEEKAKSLKNCHRSISQRGSEKLSHYVQEQFQKVVGQPKWAEIGREISDDEMDDDLFRKTGKFIEKSKSLPTFEIDFNKCCILVESKYKRFAVKSVEFHPTARVALVAGTNGTVNLYQVDGIVNEKIQSVHFENFPIHCAHFALSGEEFLVGSNKHGHYFSYDMMSGKSYRIPGHRGMEQHSIRKFHMSPNGKFIVIIGRYGHIHLVTTKTKEWIGSMKMNGEVISIAFNKDGSKMFSHGVGGEVYVWDMNSRKCIHKFVDEGSITGTSLAVSPNDQFLAAGSDTGVVNIYDSSTLFESNTPHPVKVLMNLTTEITSMKFNCTSEILAMHSEHKGNAVKLVHFPSMTVFSNFPHISDNKRQNLITSMDFSANSGYLCLGITTATAYLYRLNHYHNY